MTLENKHRWQFLDASYLPTILRVGLGAAFVIGGAKLAFPTDPQALAASYIDPSTGWIAPVFADKITGTLGMDIAEFLRVQGLLEIGLGVALISGAFTTAVATMMGLMFWAFTVANPVVGQIRLSRDIALMGLCFALAMTGAGGLSLDRGMQRIQPKVVERKDAFLLIVRLSLAYTLMASALFSGGAFSHHLNTTLPLVVVLLMGVSLAAGVFPRWTMILVFVWMLYLLPTNLLAKGLLPGLDSVKREIGFLAASFVYLLAGPDRWAWPKARHQPPP
ncbi:MAG: hypothetical protein HY702_06085 [Gemmatimonadetes bacterium]|nr:hypothetical protein [Gemmatimonadota bacterium]